MTPARQITLLYRSDNGYEISEAEEKAVDRAKSSATYGEIKPASVTKLLRYLDLGKNDVLYDLGSGVGKTVLQAALTVPSARHVGIELVPSRHKCAMRMLKKLKAQGLLGNTDVRFRKGDILRARLGDATVLYTCSTAFPEEFMNLLAAKVSRLREGIRLVSLQDLDPNPYFEEEHQLTLDVSWRPAAAVHVYRLTKQRKPRAPYEVTW